MKEYIPISLILMLLVAIYHRYQRHIENQAQKKAVKQHYVAKAILEHRQGEKDKEQYLTMRKESNKGKLANYSKWEGKASLRFNNDVKEMVNVKIVEYVKNEGHYPSDETITAYIEESIPVAKNIMLSDINLLTPQTKEEVRLNEKLSMFLDDQKETIALIKLKLLKADSPEVQQHTEFYAFNVARHAARDVAGRAAGVASRAKGVLVGAQKFAGNYVEDFIKASKQGA